MQIIETKTRDLDHHRRRKKGGQPPAQRPPVWRPEASGLTQAELRQIVLDTLG